MRLGIEGYPISCFHSVLCGPLGLLPGRASCLDRITCPPKCDVLHTRKVFPRIYSSLDIQFKRTLKRAPVNRVIARAGEDSPIARRRLSAEGDLDDTVGHNPCRAR